MLTPVLQKQPWESPLAFLTGSEPAAPGHPFASADLQATAPCFIAAKGYIDLKIFQQHKSTFVAVIVGFCCCFFCWFGWFVCF